MGDARPKAARSRFLFSFVAFGCAILAMYVAYSGLPSISRVIEEGLGLSNSQLGLVKSVTMLPEVLLPVFAGVVVDSVGYKWPFATGVLLVSLGGALRALGYSAGWMYLTSAIIGTGRALVLPSVASYHRTAVPKDLQAKVTGFITGSNAGGIALGVALTPVILRSFGGDWRATLAATGAASAVVCLLWLASSPSETERRGVPALRNAFSGISAIICKDYLLLLFVVCILNANYMVLNNWLPFILAERGMSLPSAGWLTSIIGLVAIPTGILTPALSNALKSRRIPYSVALAGTGMLFVALGLGADEALTAAGFGLTIGACIPLMVLTINELPSVSPLQAGKAFGLVSSAASAVSFGAVASYGVGRDATGGFTLQIMVSAASLFLAAVLAFCMSETYRRPVPAVERSRSRDGDAR